MTPARTRTRCVAPGCQQAQSESEGVVLCEDHVHGRVPWHQQRSRVTRGPRRRTVLSANPWSGQHRCPSCGGNAWTMPVDPEPGFSASIGRKRWPARLWNCCACSTTFIAPPPASSPSVAPSPEAAGGENGGEREPRSHTNVPGGLASAAVAPNMKDPAGATRRGPNGSPETTQRAG